MYRVEQRKGRNILPSRVINCIHLFPGAVPLWVFPWTNSPFSSSRFAFRSRDSHDRTVGGREDAAPPNGPAMRASPPTVRRSSITETIAALCTCVVACETQSGVFFQRAASPRPAVLGPLRRGGERLLGEAKAWEQVFRKQFLLPRCPDATLVNVVRIRCCFG